ncbi:hypothetical protein L2E75_00195 [Planktothrix agardhii 1807]|uniref:hypothetical protein n=1 Tax=Planktothrix agardhii TaxID=1160 RepID=UPI001F45F9B4|nr:hypothetical protein [Planktothrix agardhii]MCF3564568.1 hypothetical protein [Planktothrix agardhii 1807]
MRKSRVANINDLPTGNVSITGTATQNQTLTATNTLADADGLGTLNIILLPYLKPKLGKKYR